MANAQANPLIRRGDWVVVCDGAKALVLQNIGTVETLKLQTRSVFTQTDPKTSDIGTDAPGRAFSSVGSARSAVGQTDWHDQNEQRFLTELATRLDAAAARGDVPGLVIVAPPRALGVLRETYSEPLRRTLRGEIERDYVNLPLEQIERHLAA
jgi:protein required for attachment to host cells